jgi:four helix bundle protein
MATSSFRQLEVWKLAHELVLEVYCLTSTFPGDEKFGLVSQMRRAAVSVPANIAEGYKRRSSKEKIRFYNTAEASLEELRYYFLLSEDLGLTNVGSDLDKKADSIARMLGGLIRKIESRS